MNLCSLPVDSIPLMTGICVASGRPPRRMSLPTLWYHDRHVRPDHLGAMATSGFHSQHRPLATDGIRFERAYTSVPVRFPAYSDLYRDVSDHSGMHDFAATN